MLGEKMYGMCLNRVGAAGLRRRLLSHRRRSAPVRCVRAPRCVPVRGPWGYGPAAVGVPSPAFLGFPEEDGERAFCVGPHLRRRLGQRRVISQSRGTTAKDARVCAERDKEQP